MIRIRDISLQPGEKQSALSRKAAKILGIRPDDILTLTLKRRSIDARRKKDLHWVCTVDVSVKGNEKKLIEKAKGKVSAVPETDYIPPKPDRLPEIRPVVIGLGPAGLFAALLLARSGLCPVVLERGLDVDSRSRKVEEFWSSGKLDPDCNVQFGEGGAGAFSDGKLNTGINDPRISFILETLHKAGAQEDILYDARPHVGTDILRKVVKRIREEITQLGGTVHFGCQVTALQSDDGRLTGLWLKDGSLLPCSHAILAIGHSARDTFEMLHARGIPMKPKAFSMGVRIEHPQGLVNHAQYGAAWAESGLLPPADYHLNCRFPQGDSAYTFCMCPGGYVVAAASEDGGVVTNGMSYSGRSGENANAALLVTLTPDQFPDQSTLGGMYWQREIEQRAFRAGGCSYHAPAQTVGDFLSGKTGSTPGRVSPTYKPGVTWCDLHDVLPHCITATLEKAIPELGRRLSGFDDGDAVLTATDTRSSSPVRILRDESHQSALRGLFPCGEGAGYAGGIVSAAADGLRCAEALIHTL